MMAGRKFKSQVPNRNKSLFSINTFHVTEKLCFDLISPLQPGVAYLCPLKISENLKVF